MDQDLEQAFIWLKIAANEGNSKAKQKLIVVKQSFDQAALTRAKNRALTCITTQFKEC